MPEQTHSILAALRAAYSLQRDEDVFCRAYIGDSAEPLCREEREQIEKDLARFQKEKVLPPYVLARAQQVPNASH